MVRTGKRQHYIVIVCLSLQIMLFPLRRTYDDDERAAVHTSGLFLFLYAQRFS